MKYVVVAVLLLCFALAGCFKVPQPPASENVAATSPGPTPVLPSEPQPIMAPKGVGLSGPVEVRVMKASWQNVVVKGINRQREKPLFALTVHLRNTSKTKIVDYHGWCATTGSLFAQAELKDNFGNRYTATYLGIGEQIEDGVGHTRLRPGEEAIDILTFDQPLPSVTHLRLALPHRAFADAPQGQLTFHIPVAMIDWVAAK